MVLVFILLSLAIIGLGIFIICKNDDELGAFITVIGIGVIIITSIFSIFIISDVVESKYIDSKIAMYQEENAAIEKDVEQIVEQYQNHEKKLFNMSKVNSANTLIQMYPELKSDKLVKSQIEIYNENNAIIKKLKLKQIDCEKAKFWLYFGG